MCYLEQCEEKFFLIDVIYVIIIWLIFCVEKNLVYDQENVVEFYGFEQLKMIDLFLLNCVVEVFFVRRKFVFDMSWRMLVLGQDVKL